MAYDEQLAEAVRRSLFREKGIEEKKMFGGIGFLINGNMALGILGNELIVRVGTQAHAELLQLPHSREFDITGRVMRGWLMVSPAGYRNEGLDLWVARGITFARTLPPK